MILLLTTVSALKLTDNLTQYFTFDGKNIKGNISTSEVFPQVNGSFQATAITNITNARIKEGVWLDQAPTSGRPYMTTEFWAGRNLQDPFTINLWINTTTVDNGVFLGMQHNTVIFQFYQVSNRLGVLILDRDANIKEKRSQAFPTRITDQGWHMITAVINGTNVSDIHLYMDGNRTADFNISVANLSIERQNLTFYIGARNQVPGGAPAGTFQNFTVDEAGLWNRSLTAPEIKFLYNNRSTIRAVPPQLVRCDAQNNVTTFNFTVRNLTTSSLVRSEIDGTFEYTTFNGTFTQEKFNFSFSTVNKTQPVCIDQDFTSLITDFQIDFSPENWTEIFSRFAQKIVAKNQTKIFDLFIVDGTTPVILNVKDTSDNNIENALITIDEYDVGTNTFRTVEVLSTDTFGNALADLVLTTTWYRFTIFFNGQVRLVDGPTRVTATTKNFRIDLVGGDWADDLQEAQGVLFNLSFTNSTKNFRLTYSDPQANSEKVCLKVLRLNTTGNVELGDTCLTTTSGTILVTIGNNTNTINRVYFATAYAIFNGNEIILDQKQVDFLTEWRFYKESQTGYAALIAFLTVVGVTFIGIWNPAAAIMLLIGAFGALRIIGIYYMSTPVFITLIILGGVTIYKVNSSK